MLRLHGNEDICKMSVQCNCLTSGVFEVLFSHFSQIKGSLTQCCLGNCLPANPMFPRELPPWLPHIVFLPSLSFPQCIRGTFCLAVLSFINFSFNPNIS